MSRPVELPVRWFLWSALATFLALLLVYIYFVPYGLAWNLTGSIPKGLYFTEKLSASAVLARGDTVCQQYRAPEWAATRQYGAPRLSICKPVAGLPADPLLVDGPRLSVSAPDGSARTQVLLLPTDSKGRPMPQNVNATGPVPAGTVFLLAPRLGNSLDSRYLGPAARESLTHRIYPLLTSD